MSANEEHRRTPSVTGESDAHAANLPMRDFANSLPMALLSTRELVMSRFRPLLRRYELTEQQWRVLRALVETTQVEVTELAKLTYILSPSLSRILPGLEDRGLLKRTVVRSDQRRALISITPKGYDLFNTIAPDSEAHYTRISDTFGTAKLAKLYDLLIDLRRSLETENP